MAIPSKYGIDKKINSMEGLSAYENGGTGSGNFGHAGREGKVGGSAPSGNGGSKKKPRGPVGETSLASAYAEDSTAELKARVKEYEAAYEETMDMQEAKDLAGEISDMKAELERRKKAQK